MVNENTVFDYVLSFVQDPVEPRLMFLGTETGLYFSIDAGKNWTHWTNGYPNVSTRDMVIHPREYDLVIGTFGRAVWILDDIRPLREMATHGTSLLDEEIKAYPTPVAYITARKNAPGYFAGGNSYFQGENRRSGAMITFSVKKGEKQTPITSGRANFNRRNFMFGGGFPNMNPKAKRVKIEIINSENKVIRTLSVIPKTGMNRTYWGLDKKGFRWPNQPVARKGSPERGGGGYALPGTYKLRFTYNKIQDSTFLTVKANPNLNFNSDVITANQKKIKPALKKVELLAKAYDQIKESKATIAQVKKLMPKKKDEKTKKLRESNKEVEKAMKEMTVNMFAKENVQGIYRNPDLITSKIRSLRYAFYSFGPLTTTQQLSIKQAEALIDQTLVKVNKFYNEDWPKYRKAVEEAKLSLFKETSPLK